MTAVTRRERLRQELVVEIRASARRQLATNGTVTWRTIAKEVGMSPASLYTYFDSLDDVYTAIITESFHEQAEVLERAVAVLEDGTTVDRLMAAIVAYRWWAVRERESFKLLYFSPIPGYEAPEDGPTVRAVERVYGVLLHLISEGWTVGDYPVPPPGPSVPSSIAEKFELEVDDEILRVGIGAWATWHGLVALEINGHLDGDWIDGEALYLAEAAAICERLAGVRPAADVADRVVRHLSSTG